MKRPPFRERIGQLALFFWEILFVMLFMVGVGRQSGIHIFYFGSLQSFRYQLINIDFSAFFIELFKAFLGIFIFFLSALGIGLGLLKLVLRRATESINGISIIATAFAMGQSAYSILLLFSIVTTYQLHKYYTLAVLITGLIFTIVYIRPFSTEAYKQLKSGFESLHIYDKLEIGLLIAVFSITLLYSSSRLSYDAASQYFVYAKIIALTEHYTSFAFKDVFVGSSLYLTDLYAAIIQLFGDQAARMYSWISGLMILTFGWMIAGKVGLSQRARWLFIALLLTSTAFIDLLGDGKIDLATLSITLAAVYWTLQSLEDKTKVSFLITGFLLSTAIISRPYNITTLGIFFVLVVLFYVCTEEARWRNYLITLWKYLIWLLPSVFFSLIFYLVVNNVVLKSPFAPIQVFQQPASDWPVHITGGNLAILLVFYPYVATFIGPLDNLGFVLPLFLAFLPTFFVRDSQKQFPKGLILVSLAALGALIIWLLVFGSVQIMETRYVLFLWIVLFLPMAHLVDQASEHITASKYATQLILLFILSFMAVREVVVAVETYSPIDKAGEPHCYNLTSCTFFEKINQIASPGDRILFLSGYRYYLRPDLFECSSNGDEYSILEKLASESPDEFWKEIYRQGYRFIIYDSFFTEYILRLHSLPNLQDIPAWSHLSVLYNHTFKDYDWRDTTEAVYQIDSADLPIRAEKVCVKDNNNVWAVQPIK